MQAQHRRGVHLTNARRDASVFAFMEGPCTTCLLLLLVTQCSNVAFTQSVCTDVLCTMQENILTDIKRNRFPQVFFPDSNEQPKYVSIWSEVLVNYPNGSENCEETNVPIYMHPWPQTGLMATESWQWTHRWAHSPILKLLGNGDLYVHMSACSVLSLGVLFLDQIALNYESQTCKENCVVMRTNVTIGCAPNEESIREQWESVIQWSKAYSLSLTSPSWQHDLFDPEDIGYILHIANGWYSGSYKLVHDSEFTNLTVSFLMTQLMLNITISVLLMWFVPIQVIKYSDPDPSHEKLRVPVLSSPKTVGIRLYWSFFTLGGLVFLSFLLAELTRYFWFKDSIVFQLINMSSVVVLLILELVFAIIVSKEIRYLYVPKGFVFVASVLCLDIITKKRRYYRAIVAASLWILMGFCQLSAASVVPLVILLMISFIRTLSSVAIFYSLLFFILIIVASIAHNFHMISHHAVSRLRATVEVVAIIVIIGFITTTIAMFWILILDGFKADSVSDLLWSLGLPAALSGAGVYIKKAYLKEVEKEAAAVDQAAGTASASVGEANSETAI